MTLILAVSIEKPLTFLVMVKSQGVIKEVESGCGVSIAAKI